MYEIFERTADLGLRVKAKDLSDLFAEAGKALFSVILANPKEVLPRETSQIQLAGKELDYLLLDWLSELLFFFDSKGQVLVEFAVNLVEEGLSATVKGEMFDPTRHHIDHEVKAITYHNLRVKQVGDAWLAEVILDI